MTKIILNGIHGKMGVSLQNIIAQRNDCTVVAGIDMQEKSSDIPVFKSLDECDVTADVLIDFSNANIVDKLLDSCIDKNLPCVICTTGLSDETLSHMQKASEKIAVFKSANMSLGINVLIALAKKANELLGLDYDVEIIEKHHHNKLDAPSGTALMIADAMKDASPNDYYYVYDRHEVRQKREPLEMGLHAIRGGGIVGDHDVLFCGQNETITLSHSAGSRDVFANGAVNAALFLAGKAPGLYSMNELIAKI